MESSYQIFSSNLNRFFFDLKKTVFEVDLDLAIHKIAFAFFLDNEQRALDFVSREHGEFLVKFLCKEKDFVSLPSPHPLDGLKKYEWLAGSLTSKRMGLELSAFLSSKEAEALSHAAQNQIASLVPLFQDTMIHEVIDQKRATNLSLIFLAKTGSPLMAGQDYRFGSEVASDLSSMVIDKIRTLQSGEKVLFPAGTVLHETLICIEKRDEEFYEFSYYDSAASESKPLVYVLEEKGITDSSFWEGVYSIKLPPPEKLPNLWEHISAHFEEHGWEGVYSFKLPSPDKLPDLWKHISTHLEKYGKPIPPSDLEWTGLPRQKKNTCHFMCLLACLKDHLIRKSSLPTTQALLEWSLFKRQFGAFLIQSGEIKDEKLLQLSKIKQAKREKKTLFENHVLLRMGEGKAEETIQSYLSLLSHLSPSTALESLNRNHPLKALKALHKKTIKILENQLVTPEQVQHLVVSSDPCIQYTLTLFTERFQMRSKLFKQQLQKEWDQIQDPIASWRTFSSHTYARTPYAIAPLEREELSAWLSHFESHPESLNFILSKPNMRILLYQAIQVGEVEKVAKIYSKLSEEDQKNFNLSCSLFPFNLSFLPIEKYFGTPLIKALQVILVEKLLADRKFNQIPHLYPLEKKARNSLDQYQTKNSLSKQEIHSLLEEKIGASLPDWLEWIANLSLNYRDPEFLNSLRKYEIPNWGSILDAELASLLVCEKVKFRKLSKTGSLGSDPPFVLTSENFTMALPLIESALSDLSTLRWVFSELLTVVYESQSEEILSAILEALSKNPLLKKESDELKDFLVVDASPSFSNCIPLIRVVFNRDPDHWTENGIREFFGSEIPL